MTKRLVNSTEQLAVLLKTTRKARKLTQGELAARMSISANRYSELESDIGALTVQRLFQLTQALGLEITFQSAGEPSAAAAAGGKPQW